MLLSVLMVALSNNEASMPWWAYVLFAVAGSVAMKLSQQMKSRKKRHDAGDEYAGREESAHDDEGGESLWGCYARRKAMLKESLCDGHLAFLEDYANREGLQRVSFSLDEGNFTAVIPTSMNPTADMKKNGSLLQMLFTGDSLHEWVYVEHESALDVGLHEGEKEMEDRVEFQVQMQNVLPIHPPGGAWSEGVLMPIRRLIGIDRCVVDHEYMKRRGIDTMASWVATCRLGNVVCRILILAFQCGNQGWMVEYGFPVQASEMEHVDNDLSHAECERAQVVLGSFAPSDSGAIVVERK